MNPAAFSAAARGDWANAIVASTPGGIEAQEAAGQRALVASEMLPKEINGATREQLTALGFVFGEDVDELFVRCQLPPGWQKKATEHSMNSNLIDDKGRTRAGIFYKAAFYDRRADMSMQRRFDVECWRDGSTKFVRRCVVTDCGVAIKAFGEVARDDWKGQDALKETASAWLTEQHPDWKSPLACWD